MLARGKLSKNGRRHSTLSVELGAALQNASHDGVPVFAHHTEKKKEIGKASQKGSPRLELDALG